MKDRFTRGFLAGFLAAVGQAVVNLSAHYLGWTRISWFSFAGVLILGHRPQTLAEDIFAWFIALGFSGVMGVLLVYLIPRVSSDYYLFKGIAFGAAVWFAAFALAIMFRVPGLTEVNLSSAIVNFIGSSIWGVLAAEILRRLDTTVRSTD